MSALVSSLNETMHFPLCALLSRTCSSLFAREPVALAVAAVAAAAAAAAAVAAPA